MATYGEIRGLLAQQAPGIDLGLLDGWLNDRFTDILDRLPWRRTKAQTIIQTVAVYETGTVAVTANSNAVTGATTVWTAAMTGRTFRVAGDNAYYTFTRTGNTTGTLDRTYEGTTAAAASYKIAQRIFPLPSTCRLVEEARLLDPPRDLLRKSQADLNVISPHRGTYGDPFFYALYLDDASDPPLGQLEFYPVPEAVKAVPVWFVAEQTALGATATALLPWMRPGALKAGVMADIARHLKDYAGAQAYEVRFESLVADMVRTAAAEQGPSQLRMAPRFVRHRRMRGLQ